MIRSKVSLQKITLAQETEMGWEGMGWGPEGSRETSQLSRQKNDGDLMSITVSERVFPSPLYYKHFSESFQMKSHFCSAKESRRLNRNVVNVEQR